MQEDVILKEPPPLRGTRIGGSVGLSPPPRTPLGLLNTSTDDILK